MYYGAQMSGHLEISMTAQLERQNLSLSDSAGHPQLEDGTAYRQVRLRR